MDYARAEAALKRAMLRMRIIERQDAGMAGH